MGLTAQDEELEHDNPPLPRVSNTARSSTHEAVSASDVLQSGDACRHRITSGRNAEAQGPTSMLAADQIEH